MSGRTSKTGYPGHDEQARRSLRKYGHIINAVGCDARGCNALPGAVCRFGPGSVRNGYVRLSPHDARFRAYARFKEAKTE